MRDIVKVGETCSALAPSWSGVIVDADDYYRALADAIESARAYVLIAGWQLESSVWMRRRDEDEERPRTFREIVRAAVTRNPELRVYVLAWDWSSVYALDREWATSDKLRSAGRGRLRFLYDANHAPGASHHEKLAIVDGHTAWVGGIDVSEHRWDQRSHFDQNPMRFDGKGALYLPYHDVQAVTRGPIVRHLVEHFVDRWVAAGGDPMVLVPEPIPESPPFAHVPLGQGAVALTRTRGATVVPMREPVREIRALYDRVLRGAQRLVYIESQYVTARVIVEALADRMRDRSRGPLEVVVVVPWCLEGRMEKAAIEGPQRIALSVLGRIAKENGHAMGVYSPCVPRKEEGERGPCPTYIHSKLMIVDDRFLTIGSANATNRSMGLDTELNLAWATDDEHDEIARGIRTLRVSLMAEHAGVTPDEAVRDLGPIEGLVARVDALTAGERPRIRPAPLDPDLALADQGPMDDLFASIGDPETAAFDEGLFEEILERPHGIVARVVTALQSVAGARG
ncbi:phospholipase D-like domain-containing protein [Sandaracinus amylolyticus]|uniref:phospholipase D-like domain-containing protein n=1 Tax=Sandaracinus amylolyticus TaxID=927083 RepID=UPI001F237CCC|nr:phospholipase D-like domain-containing protein [Sandaracinus amylolyticus]